MLSKPYCRQIDRSILQGSEAVEAYPGPDLRIVATKVVDQSRKKLRKVAEGHETKKKDVVRIEVLQSLVAMSKHISSHNRYSARADPPGGGCGSWYGHSGGAVLHSI
jgi:hypothetical protein